MSDGTTGDMSMGDIYTQTVDGRAQNYAHPGAAMAGVRSVSPRGVPANASRDIQKPLQSLYIDLSIARTNAVLEGVVGDFIYCDVDSNGTFTLTLDDRQFGDLGQMLCGAGFKLRQPFQRLQITNTVQPAGKFCRLLIGTGADLDNPSGSGFQQQRSIQFSAAGVTNVAGTTTWLSAAQFVGRGAFIKLARAAVRITSNAGLVAGGPIGVYGYAIISDSTGVLPSFNVPMQSSGNTLALTGQPLAVVFDLSNFKLPDNDGGGPQNTTGYDTVQLEMVLKGTVGATDQVTGDWAITV